MEIKSILWPTDFSEQANGALPYVLDMSQKYGAEVHLLYVAQDVRQADHFYGDADRELLEGLQKRECGLAESLLERVCDEKLQACPSFKRHVLKGDPARTIIDFANKQGVDAIIMAAHGSGRREGEPGYFGSVTDRVMKSTAAPVFVVKPNQ